MTCHDTNLCRELRDGICDLRLLLVPLEPKELPLRPSPFAYRPCDPLHHVALAVPVRLCEEGCEG